MAAKTTDFQGFHTTLPRIQNNHNFNMVNIIFYTPKGLYKCVDYEIVCCNCHVWELTSLSKMASKMAAVRM